MIKKFIILIVAIAVIFAVYWFFIRMTKTKAIKFINENGMNTEKKDLNLLDEQTLKIWVKAIKKGQQSFTTAAGTFKVLGGS